MKITEGQLDFLGLLTEYTDEQGATVRVKEPGRGLNKHQKDVKGETRVSEAEHVEPVIEQLSFVSETKEEVTADIRPIKVTVPERPRVEPVKNEPVEALDAKRINSKEQAEKSESKTDIEKEEYTIKNTEPEIAQNPVKKPERRKVKPVMPKAVKSKEEDSTADNSKSREKLFKQCTRCWCFDCKHNSKNAGIPREMCGMMIPCPACDGCIAEDSATICEIGNAKEGCMFRAVEEGIVVPEEM